MSSARSRHTATIYLVAAVTMIGAVLRLWELGSQSLWLDEVFTARVAPLDVAGILGAIRSDLDTPPLHPLVVHAFLALGDSEFVLRLPSALAAIISIPLMYIVARRLLGRRTGLLAAMLMAWSPFAVYYAQEARMYGLVLTFALLTLYCLLRGLDGVEPIHPYLPWLGFIISSALGIYTHFFGFFVLGLAVLYAAIRLVVDWRAGQRHAVQHKVLYLVLSLVAIAALYLPWLPVLSSFFRENYAQNPYGQSWQANLQPGTMLNMVTLMLGGYWAHPLVRWAARGLFVLGWLFMARRRLPVALLVLLTLSIPFGVISVLNPGHFVTERYFVFMLPMLLLCMAEGLHGLIHIAVAIQRRIPVYLGRSGPHFYDRLHMHRVVTVSLVAFLVIPLLSLSGLAHYFSEPPKPAWRLLAHYMAGTIPTGDLIVVATFPHWDREPLQHYLKMGGRRVVYAAEEPNLRQILGEERSHPWWVVYAGNERRLGRMLSSGIGAHFTIVPFDYLAVVQRSGEDVNGLEDGRVILSALLRHIPGPYQREVQRVIDGLASSSGDMGQPILPPVPTTVR
jgi:mannosyltransferase